MIVGKAFAATSVDSGKTKSSTKERQQWNIDSKSTALIIETTALKFFTSTAPFPPLQVGDCVDASTWQHTGSKCRVLSVEHAIVEKAPLGIDPSESIINRTLIHTEGVPDGAIHEASAPSYGGR
jgi:hypothetical protein